MDYLKFDRHLVANLQESLHKEILRTNRKGAYCSTSILGCNTRKYHGILVVPIPEVSPNNHVLLSSLDVTVIQHDSPFNIGVHEYENNVFSPKGHKYIKEYNVNIGNDITYRIGGVLLKKEMFFCHYEHKVIIKFTLIDAHSKTTMQLRPLLAFRDVRMLTHKNDHINRNYELVKNGLKMKLYDNYPYMYMQFNKETKFIDEGYWNENIVYFKEKERGHNYKEDLYVPGYFELDIEKGESVYFVASLSESDTDTLSEDFEKEQNIRIPKDSFKNCLLNASQQFYYRPNDNDGYILAGYPWFNVRARDLMVSLPGCSIFSGAPERFERVMNTFMSVFKDYMNQQNISRQIQYITDPDVGLWAIWAIQQFYKWNKNKLPEKYIDFIADIIGYYLKNIHPNTRVDEKGLLYTIGDGRPLTWMDAKIDNVAVVRREGYIVEINALWYNAICFYLDLRTEIPNMDKLSDIKEKLEKNYTEVFLNEHGYLFDCVIQNQDRDWSVRPNMIFAASLEYSPLSKAQKNAILDIITKELLTPKGIRSLSPKSIGYIGYCTGVQRDREMSYYNGSAWPWLLGQYIEASIKLHGRSCISFIERILIGMQEEVQEHGIGTLSELFDGNPPFKGRGAVSFAMNVGEIIRSLYMLDREKSKYELVNPVIRYYKN